VLQTVDHFGISFLGAPFSWLEKSRNRMGWDLDCMAINNRKCVTSQPFALSVFSFFGQWGCMFIRLS
jgi:hypothetical protein